MLEGVPCRLACSGKIAPGVCGSDRTVFAVWLTEEATAKACVLVCACEQHTCYAELLIPSATSADGSVPASTDCNHAEARQLQWP